VLWILLSFATAAVEPLSGILPGVVQVRHVDCCVRASVEASKLQTKRRTQKEMTMGKYFVGWLVGVPVVVLVIAYMIFG
jgi:hypothetical protein